MEEGCNSEVPGSVSGHDQAQEGPDSVVVEWRNKDCGGTAGSEDVSPCPLVQIIIYVIYVAATNDMPSCRKCLRSLFIVKKGKKNVVGEEKTRDRERERERERVVVGGG